MAKFKREQRIVDYLNRGVSVAEIAAHVGVGQKRLRAILRDILARRQPHPPAEFVAIQVSRLNEALLVAFSAMSPSNLKAVDQVVKIVRELDRYGGAFAVEWARPEASPLEAPTEEDVAFAKAWLDDAELADDEGDDRPEIPLQSLEKIESAPGNSPAPHSLSSEAGRAPFSPAKAGERAAPAGADRPEIPAQSLEKVESAPGTGMSVQTVEAAPADPVSSATLLLTLLRDGAGRQDLRASLSRLRAGASGVAAHHGGGDFPFAASAGPDRPEIPLQGFEKIESGPEKSTETEGRRPASVPIPTLIPSAPSRGDRARVRAFLSWELAQIAA
jgi:hypothetical protein